MSQLFRLVGKNFSKADNEWQWTYLRLSPFSFNKEIIKYITITDHYKLEHKRVVTNKLMLEILTGLPSRMRARKKHNGRDIYVWEYITPNEEKEYRLVFWFKDSTTNHLWIRNCHRID